VTWIDIFIVFATIFIYYHSILSPFKLFEKLSKKKWDIMKQLASKLNDDYDKKFDFNFSIMLVRPAFAYFIEPSSTNKWISWLSRDRRQFSLFGRILDVVWDHGSNGVPPKFRLTINQGVCGKAFREGRETNKHNIKGAVLLPELLSGHDFNLNSKQKRETDGLILITSCPLVISDKEIDGLRKKVVGVLNIESRSLAAAELLAEESSRDKFYEKIANLANIYLNLHV
jgi:hypothetical protein